MLEFAESELLAAKPYFKAVSPGWSGLFVGQAAKAAKIIGYGLAIGKGAWKLHKRTTTAPQLAGEFISGKVTGKVTGPIGKVVKRGHTHIQSIDHDIRRKNGIGGRSWYTKPCQVDMVIVFHDAHRAGPHVDVHIGRLSVIYRVKPDVYAQLKYNPNGYLTENSKKLLIQMVKDEIENGSRVPQNIDHSLTNARAEWVLGEESWTHYGSARTRQVISESRVEIYKAHADGPIEFYAPALNTHRGMYLYRLYPGDGRRAPILIWGNKRHQPPVLEDRLHLKLTQPENISKLESTADMSTCTAKYDGSSCYVVVGPKGTTLWSPRDSVATSQRIEYTFKGDGIAGITSEVPIHAMGELLFVEESRWPWQKERYMSSAAGSGLLNQDKPIPPGIRPEIRLYRVDKVGRERTYSEDFWTNRERQEQLAKLDPTHLKVVELMDPDTALDRGFEGVVVVPFDASVNQGYKVKWWTDPHDWTIDKVSFEPGAKGGIAGVVWCTSLESGKTFKLGPGQMGNRALCEDMMTYPENYEGSVVKVQSRHGHEGRAAKVIGFHDDKGKAPITPLVGG